MRDNFRRYIVLPRYASRLLAVFQELCENRAVEYQCFAFVTYQTAPPVKYSYFTWKENEQAYIRL